MYVNILSEVINEKKGIKKVDKKIKSTNITIGGYIPSNYALDTDKIQIYQEIEDTQTIASIELLRRKLKDIYGKLPKEVEKILLKRKIDIIGRFTNTTPIINNGSIKNITGTNVAYVMPHIIVIKNNKYLMFDECDNVYVNTFKNKIVFKDLEDYINSH